MTKKKPKSTKLESRNTSSDTPTSPNKAATTTTASLLASDPNLGYKIRVLLYDLQHMPKDPSCEARTLQTTDALYFSEPYLTPDEARKVKSAIVAHEVCFGGEEEVGDFEVEETGTNSALSLTTAAAAPRTVEETVHFHMAMFFEKRRASGDARPCGPHTMAPLYRAIFGIGKEELEDEKFLVRLRKCGLRDVGDVGGGKGGVDAKEKKKKQEKQEKKKKPPKSKD